MKKIVMLIVFGFVINAVAQDTTAENTTCDSGATTEICGSDSDGNTECGTATCPGGSQ